MKKKDSETSKVDLFEDASECGCDCSCDCGCGCDCECDCDHDGQCECENYEALANEYLNLARQVQADFENYRKRNIEAVSQARQDGKASVIVQILPCADIIDKAIKMTTDQNTLEGLKMIANKFQDVLSSLGVVKYESIGQMFDVNKHNAVTAIESDQPSGTIVDEYESGYSMGDKVIRFAQVIISK